MNELIPLVIAALVAVAVIVVLAGNRDRPSATAPPAAQSVKMTVHGNSALAGGYIDGGQVRFYTPTPVQLLRERLQALMPGVELVDCSQNGLTLTEALRGGAVRMDNPALGGTRGTCEALAAIWQRERPAWAYVALLEVEPLFWADYDPGALMARLDELGRAALEHEVRLVLQGPIRFALDGPTVSDARVRMLVHAGSLARQWAQAHGVPWVELGEVPFHPQADVAADGLHPTMAMHIRYADARARQLAAVLAPAPAAVAWPQAGAADV